jgi:hypothetical protein
MPVDGEYTLTFASGAYKIVRSILIAKNPGPVVGISDPAEGAIIAAPTEIKGRVLSGRLRDYALSYRRKGDTAWTEFARGYNAANASILGTFDPTKWTKVEEDPDGRMLGIISVIWS